jgi:hypothetical protein
VLASLFIAIHTNFVLMIPIGFVYSIYDSTELPYKKIDRDKSNNDNDDDQSKRRRTREWRVLATANATTTITNGLSNGDSDPTTGMVPLQ